MAANYGKKFEAKFKKDWAVSIPDSFLLRIPDQVTGYYGTSQNICDFIGYDYPKLFLLELKSIQGNTFPFTNLKQYDKLIQYIGKKGIVCGVIIWYVDHSKVVFVSASELKRIKEDGNKSINIKMLDGNLYDLLEIPSKKKKVFLDSDYSVLLNL